MSQTKMGRVPEEVSMWLGSAAPHVLQVSPVLTVVQAVYLEQQGSKPVLPGAIYMLINSPGCMIEYLAINRNDVRLIKCATE